jgi:predicted flap endonuclease-1-like 5' DNA nuclease
MDYLIEQIFLYMLVAFLLGGFVGWFLCRLGASKKIAELEVRLADRKSGTPIESIEGIGAGFGMRLRADGIDTTEKLLDLCASEEGVARVCKCVDLDEDTVRNWGTMADLSRIKGLGGQWAELMWAAGVTSVQNLAAQEIEPLRARMREINEKEHRVAELPGEKRVTKFLAEARNLKPMLPNRD